MAILKFDEVTRVFYGKDSETVALDRLSFEVENGEFVAIIGPSGCGKTTILSLVCRLIEPTSGVVERNFEGDVGYMLQRDQLFEWRTVLKNVTLGLEIGKRRKNAEARAHAEELLKKYGLWEFRNHYPSEISGGMRQRAALIRTLALSPKLLLLDEPFSALDFQTRLAVCNDVYGIIKNEGATALLVTHDVSEALSLADKIIVLTARPAKTQEVIYVHMPDCPTPLSRRESPKFGKLFEKINHLLTKGTADKPE